MNIERIEKLKQIRAKLLDEHRGNINDIVTAEHNLEGIELDLEWTNAQIAALTREYQS